MIDRNNPFPDLKKLFSSFLGTQDTGQMFNERIPKGLRELYQIHESYSIIKPKNTLFYNQDNLLLPSEISGDPYFDFLIENQSCWKCETEMGQDNPSVYIHEAESIDIEGRQVIHDSLNQFLTTYALQELIFELDFSHNEHFTIGNILNSKLNVEELWIDASYTWGNSNRYHFWLIEGNCLVMKCSIHYIGTNDKQRFDQIIRLLDK